MNFVTDLPLLLGWKEDSYNSILVIVDRETKIVYYEPIRVMSDASRLAVVIINVVVYHHEVLKSIVMNQSLLFTLQF